MPDENWSYEDAPGFTRNPLIRLWRRLWSYRTRPDVPKEYCWFDSYEGLWLEPEVVKELIDNRDGPYTPIEHLLNEEIETE